MSPMSSLSLAEKVSKVQSSAEVRKPTSFHYLP